MTAREAVMFAAGELKEVSDDALFEGKNMVAALLRLPLNKLALNMDAVFDEHLKAQLEGMLDRRKLGEPLQYIIGEWEFMGLPIITRPDALIPRQDTETLVEYALNNKGNYSTALDMCCGTGCIGISLAKLGGFDVTFGDISEKCLALAKENAELNGVKGTFLHTDLFENVEGEFDLICINPPYIPTSDLASLQREVKQEPVLALDGGEDGLDFYRRIAEEYSKYLNPNGMLLMEVGIGQAADVCALFKNAFAVKDLCGIERVVVVK